MRRLVFFRLAAVCVAVAIAAVNLSDLCFRVPPAASSAHNSDLALAAEARFAGLARKLAELQLTGAIGYIQDDPRGNDATPRRYLAQYTLAPVILDSNNPSAPWLLLDFKDGAARETEFEGYSVRWTSGDGVLLLQRHPSP